MKKKLDIELLKKDPQYFLSQLPKEAENRNSKLIRIHIL